MKYKEILNERYNKGNYTTLHEVNTQLKKDLDSPSLPQSIQKTKDFQSEEEYIEDANRRLEKELDLIKKR